MGMNETQLQESAMNSEHGMTWHIILLSEKK